MAYRFSWQVYTMNHVSFTFEDRFLPRPAPRWRRTAIGGGRLIVTDAGLRLALAGAHRAVYADAQIDDYAGLPRPGAPPRGSGASATPASPSTARRCWRSTGRRAGRSASSPGSIISGRS